MAHSHAPRASIPRLLGTRHVRISLLQIDPEYQREIKWPWVKWLAENFDFTLFGTINVSEREDGLYVMDGAHRVEACRMKGWTEIQVPCVIQHGLEKRTEAHHFSQYNTQRKAPTAYDIFHSERTAGNPQVLRVNGVLSSLGLIAAPTYSTDPRAVRALQTVMELEKYHGPGMLARVLAITLESWPHDALQSRNKEVLDSVTAFIVTHAARGHAVDDKLICRSCARLGIGEFVARARQVQSNLSGYKVLAANIQLGYNRLARGPARVEELAPGQYTKRPRRPTTSKDEAA